MSTPRIALTIGDVAGIGPEVVVRACIDKRVRDCCRPVVVGHPAVLGRAMQIVGADISVTNVEQLDQPAVDSTLGCFNPTDELAAEVAPGAIDARAGQAAYDYLIAAAQAALDQRVEAVVTAPLNKAALHRAGLNYPGHTEILAERCGVNEFAMMLYLPPSETLDSPHGLGVAHATLHTSIQSVPALLNREMIQEKIHLIDGFLQDIGCAAPRLGVCALNPHAGEEGLFGDEERELIAPAVRESAKSGMNVQGPLPADTLLKRAVAGEFDGVVAMYHDQGHIALKLIGFDRAVNITLGLPIVRTSPSHGTAFDIAWQGKADAEGMIGAIQIAARLARSRT